MKDVFFSIDASIVLNGKNIRGVLSIDVQKITFVSNNEVLLEKRIKWDRLEYSVSKEKVRKFFLFSKIKYVISFKDNGVSLPILIADEENGEKITKAVAFLRDTYMIPVQK